MKTTIKYTTNEEGWALERSYREEGWKKTSDCYWYQTYEGAMVISSFWNVNKNDLPSRGG